MAGRHDNQAHDFLGSALAALVEVMLVSLSLGMAIGFGATPLVAVLAVALAATASVSVVLLRRHARQGHGPLDADAGHALADEPIGEVVLSHDAARATDSERLEDVALAAMGDGRQAEDDEAPGAPSSDPLLMAHPEAELAAADVVTLAPPPSTLDLDLLSKRIVGVADPIAELKLFVGDIRTREAEGAGSPGYPSPFERYAARVLSEAGLFERDVELPTLRVVRPSASNMFYLRVVDRTLPYLAKVRVLAIEAALNALRFSARYFDDPDQHGVEEHYQLVQKLTRSVTAQSPNLPDNVPVIEDDSPDTEWAVRLGISTAIESFQLPHRLAAAWRVNVADGNVAFEIELAPERAFPATRYVEDLGLVSTSREMRRMAASDYALRLAILVAAAAFRCSERIHHVWVAGILLGATRRSCLLSVDFDRWRFERLDLSNLGDLREAYRSFVPVMRYDDGILRPVEQTFALDEARFCPARRFEPVSLSTRRIRPPFSEALGTDHVFGLAIDEGEKRAFVAADIMGRLGDTTEENVRLIMEVAGNDPDPTVRGAAERTVRRLIEGSLDDDAQSVGEEFLMGDALSRASMRAYELLGQGKPEEAERLLRPVLDPIDEAGIFADTSHLEHRFFPSYVDRALYNRLYALEGHAPMLVPARYFNAHMLLAFSQLMQDKPDQALEHAQRLVELSPLDARSHLLVVRCLDQLDRNDEAIAALRGLLEIAHDPEGVGMAYYRMAFFQWERGNTLATQACYARALQFLPGYTPVVAMEMGTLALRRPGAFREDLTEEEAEQILEDAGIPLAPTSEMAETFLDCARASLDAEVFPVARNFAWIIGAFSRDDIMFGLLRSIEEGPGQSRA